MAYKQKGIDFGNSKFDFSKKTDYSQKAIDERRRRKKDEALITKEHNTEAEIDNPTGETCMTCGEDIKGHTKAHPFKKYKGKEKKPGAPDMKTGKYKQSFE